jgi:hypothetical protein
VAIWRGYPNFMMGGKIIKACLWLNPIMAKKSIFIAICIKKPLRRCCNLKKSEIQGPAF